MRRSERCDAEGHGRVDLLAPPFGFCRERAAAVLISCRCRAAVAPSSLCCCRFSVAPLVDLFAGRQRVPMCTFFPRFIQSCADMMPREGASRFVIRENALLRIGKRLLACFSASGMYDLLIFVHIDPLSPPSASENRRTPTVSLVFVRLSWGLFDNRRPAWAWSVYFCYSVGSLA